MDNLRAVVQVPVTVTVTPLHGVKRSLLFWSCCELSPSNFTAEYSKATVPVEHTLNYLDSTVSDESCELTGLWMLHFCCNSQLIAMWAHWTVNASFLLQKINTHSLPFWSKLLLFCNNSVKHWRTIHCSLCLQLNYPPVTSHCFINYPWHN